MWQDVWGGGGGGGDPYEPCCVSNRLFHNQNHSEHRVYIIPWQTELAWPLTNMPRSHKSFAQFKQTKQCLPRQEEGEFQTVFQPMFVEER